MTEAPLETARLDVWLWRARFFKTRALAGRSVSKTGVRVTRFGQTRRTSKPGAGIAAGDILTFTQGRHIQVVEVLGLGERRGPAQEAKGLYQHRDG
ncbi:MAG: RNA-binding S4 domain-containing protein [Pseudomonadota bacterium]